MEYDPTMNNYPNSPHIEVRELDLAYGSFTVLRNLNFTVQRGEVMVIMGGSGCGKSTLLKHLIGLMEPVKGDILYNGKSFVNAEPSEQKLIMRNFGVLYQSGALWSSMTLAENVALPLEVYTALSSREIADVVTLKLSLVGLKGYEEFYPSEMSGGMRKRAGLARAMALDPEILFFDEPSAGLDPVTSRRLDELILQLRDGLGTTVVVVTHELPSIFAIADNSIFLDPETRTMIAKGKPAELLKHPPDPKVTKFLTRGGTEIEEKV